MNLQKNVSHEKNIPFEVSIDPFYNESNMQAIDESIKQLERGQVIIKSLAELEAMENG